MRNIAHFLSIFTVLFVAVFLFGNITTRAYSIPFDSLNGGGERSSSSAYILESSLGQVDSGQVANSVSKLSSGFQQGFITGTYIDIAVDYPSGTEATLDSISGFLSGQIGNGSANVTVTTDYDGYTLYVKASTSPAFKCLVDSGCDAADAFANYTPAGGVGVPDFAWSVADSAAEFGYTAKGSDIPAKFKYDVGGSTCGSGSSASAAYCWDAMTTSDVSVASANAANDPDGAVTTLLFRSQTGSTKLMPSGTYTSSITATAIANM